MRVKCSIWYSCFYQMTMWRTVHVTFLQISELTLRHYFNGLLTVKRNAVTLVCSCLLLPYVILHLFPQAWTQYSGPGYFFKIKITNHSASVQGYKAQFIPSASSWMEASDTSEIMGKIIYLLTMLVIFKQLILNKPRFSITLQCLSPKYNWTYHVMLSKRKLSIWSLEHNLKVLMFSCKDGTVLVASEIHMLGLFSLINLK